jgi:hypothetical protein
MDIKPLLDIIFGSTLHPCIIIIAKSVLGRVRNCVGDQALQCRHPTCQPNHSYADSMFCLHSDLTHGCVVVGMLH